VLQSGTGGQQHWANGANVAARERQSQSQFGPQRSCRKHCALGALLWAPRGPFDKRVLGPQMRAQGKDTSSLGPAHWRIAVHCASQGPICIKLWPSPRSSGRALERANE